MWCFFVANFCFCFLFYLTFSFFLFQFISHELLPQLFWIVLLLLDLPIAFYFMFCLPVSYYVLILLSLSSSLILFFVYILHFCFVQLLYIFRSDPFFCLRTLLSLSKLENELYPAFFEWNTGVLWRISWYCKKKKWTKWERNNACQSTQIQRRIACNFLFFFCFAFFSLFVLHVFVCRFFSFLSLFFRFLFSFLFYAI